MATYASQPVIYYRETIGTTSKTFDFAEIDKLGNAETATKAKGIIKYIHQLKSAELLLQSDLRCLELGSVPNGALDPLPAVEEQVDENQSVLSLEDRLRLRIELKQKEIELLGKAIRDSTLELGLKLPTELYMQLCEHYTYLQEVNKYEVSVEKNEVRTQGGRAGKRVSAKQTNAQKCILTELEELRDPMVLDTARSVALITRELRDATERYQSDLDCNLRGIFPDDLKPDVMDCGDVIRAQAVLQVRMKTKEEAIADVKELLSSSLVQLVDKMPFDTFMRFCTCYQIVPANYIGEDTFLKKAGLGRGAVRGSGPIKRGGLTGSWPEMKSGNDNCSNGGETDGKANVSETVISKNLGCINPETHPGGDSSYPVPLYSRLKNMRNADGSDGRSRKRECNIEEKSSYAKKCKNMSNDSNLSKTPEYPAIDRLRRLRDTCSSSKASQDKRKSSVESSNSEHRRRGPGYPDSIMLAEGKLDDDCSEMLQTITELDAELNFMRKSKRPRLENSDHQKGLRNRPYSEARRSLQTDSSISEFVDTHASLEYTHRRYGTERYSDHQRHAHRSRGYLESQRSRRSNSPHVGDGYGRQRPERRTLDYSETQHPPQSDSLQPECRIGEYFDCPEAKYRNCDYSETRRSPPSDSTHFERGSDGYCDRRSRDLESGHKYLGPEHKAHDYYDYFREEKRTRANSELRRLMRPDSLNPEDRLDDYLDQPNRRSSDYSENRSARPSDDSRFEHRTVASDHRRPEHRIYDNSESRRSQYSDSLLSERRSDNFLDYQLSEERTQNYADPLWPEDRNDEFLDVRRPTSRSRETRQTLWPRRRTHDGF